MARLVKRALADVENAVLAAAETAGAPGGAGDVALADLLAGWAGLLGDPLRQAARSAAAIVGAADHGEGPALDDLAAVVSADVEEHLGARLRELGDEPDPRRVRSAFRQWRAERLGPCVAEVVSAAIARGVVASVTVGAPVSWQCHPDGACPDGEDNQLAGVMALGDPFPTGHELPPGCAGCRCLVAPAPG